MSRSKNGELESVEVPDRCLGVGVRHLIGSTTWQPVCLHPSLNHTTVRSNPETDPNPPASAIASARPTGCCGVGLWSQTVPSAASPRAIRKGGCPQSAARIVASPMSFTFHPPAPAARCLECQKPPPGPNCRQKTCSAACAQKRKLRLQSGRRQSAQVRTRAAWSCACCGSAATGFVKGRRITCSPACALIWRTSQQQERRFDRTVERALSALRAHP